jgi:hypothetical protein
MRFSPGIFRMIESRAMEWDGSLGTKKWINNFDWQINE